MKNQKGASISLAILLAAMTATPLLEAADTISAGPSFLVSFDDGDEPTPVAAGDTKLAEGLRGKGQRVPAKRQPFAVALPEGAWGNDQGSVTIWWRPEWTREQTHGRFGLVGSTQRGFFGLPLDRPFDAGDWHQIVTTWNKNNVVRHYVDGELVRRQTRRPDPWPEKPWLWLGSSTIWQVSPSGSGAPTGPAWAVTIDELRIHRRPISIDEIQADYLAGVIARGQMRPDQAVANRVIDVRLGQKKIIGSRHKPMYGFPSIGKDAQGNLYLKAKLGGEYNQGNRWNRSTDGGRTWKSVKGSSVTKTMRGVKSKDNTWIAPDFPDTEVKGGMLQGFLRVTAADGSELPSRPITLQAPFKTGKFYDATWMVSPTVLRSRDGGMLVLMTHHTAKDHSSTLWLVKSSDEGRAWKPLSEVVKRSPLFLEGINEAALLRGADGSLICLARTGWPMVVARSTDDGRTWRPWNFLGVDGVKPDAITLDDGLAVCAFGRPDVNLLISLDANARQWDAPFQLLNANRTPHNILGDWHQNGTFYADLVEVEPGRVLVVYDTAGDTGQPGQLPQCRLWLQEVLIDSIANFDVARSERLTPAGKRLEFRGRWHVANSSPYAATREDGAEVRFAFEGTGLVAQVSLLPDGGDLEVWIDGRRQRILKTAASHTHWLARRVLARDLKPGRHTARLVTRCEQLPRPLLPSIQELMRTNHVETIRDSQGQTRVVLHAVEVINEKGRQSVSRGKLLFAPRNRRSVRGANNDKIPAKSPPADRAVSISGLTLSRDDVLIHSDFDGHTEPTIAPKGDITHQFRRPGTATTADGKIAQRDQPVFTTGIRGQSLSLRKTDGATDTLLWSLPKTPVPKEGTLFFWFRPQWPSHEVGRKGARPLLNFTPFPPIQKWGRLHFSVFHTSAYHIRGRNSVPWGRFWKSNSWHHLAVSWSADNTQRLYFDGELVALAEGKPPQHPEGFALSMTGESEMDIDELTLISRRLTRSEVETSYVSGLHAQNRLVAQTPAIRVQVGEPVEAVGQQARGFNQLIRFPELFRQNDGAVLLRSDNRNISLHFYDARDAVEPAGKQLRWFKSDGSGAAWKEIKAPEHAARNQYRGSDGKPLLLGETAEHKGAGIYETTLRRGQVVPKSISADDLIKATFHAGIEPSTTADNRLYLNRSSIVTRDGNVLISGFIRPKGQWKSHLLIFTTVDGGRTWRRISDVWQDNRFVDRISSPINGAPPLFGPTQASLLRTSVKRILCVFRTDAALLACESTDEGRTWSEPWMVGSDGVNPTLAKSGELLALSYGRPDVNIAFSADKGKTWFGFTDLLPSDRSAVEASALVGPLGYNFKPGTGHVALLPDGPNRFLIAYDTNWVSNPKFELPRASLWVTSVSVTHKATPEVTRFVSAAGASVQRSGTWVGGGKSTPYLSSGDGKGKLRFEFKGTGITLVHPTYFDGGRLRVLIDGKEVSHVDLRTPQSWWGRRTLLAEGLSGGNHVVELIADIQTAPRAPVMPDRWPSYEPYYPALFDAAGRTRAVVHGFEVW